MKKIKTVLPNVNISIIRSLWIQVRKAIKLSWFKDTALGTRTKVILVAL